MSNSSEDDSAPAPDAGTEDRACRPCLTSLFNSIICKGKDQGLMITASMVVTPTVCARHRNGVIPASSSPPCMQPFPPVDPRWNTCCLERWKSSSKRKTGMSPLGPRQVLSLSWIGTSLVLSRIWTRLDMTWPYAHETLSPVADSYGSAMQHIRLRVLARTLTQTCKANRGGPYMTRQTPIEKGLGFSV